MKALSHGLNIQKKPGGAAKPASLARRAVFDDDDDDKNDSNAVAHSMPIKATPTTRAIDTFDLDQPEARPPKLPLSKPGSSAAPPPAPRPKAAPLSVDLSTTLVQHRRAGEAETLDPAIYDYDAAYDALHAKDTAKAAAERADARERRPKYMEGLMAAAEVRKRDQLRAKDRLLAQERAAEGEEFADKEKFVTGAYKAQQEEVRRMEEQEKEKEEEEARKRRGKGMQGFYRGVMEQEEEKHKEIVRAAAQAGTLEVSEAGGGEIEEEKSAAEQAKRLNAQGANVIINDEGQVVDKRQLLGAGLNIVPKPSSGVAVSAPGSSAREVAQPAYQGRSAAQKASRERQTRMIEDQLAQAQKRAAEEELQERERVEKTAKSSKTETDVSSARERFLQRKKEAEALKAAGTK